eukprot:GHVN01106175.1.p1 GENE.GHVN01106175.1~~GHVN01106175.1.p1  ORF type:complete len:1626 (+),score=335.15 GHVN01106175.1:98-4879(+)
MARHPKRRSRGPSTPVNVSSEPISYVPPPSNASSPPKEVDLSSVSPLSKIPSADASSSSTNAGQPSNSSDQKGDAESRHPIPSIPPLARQRSSASSLPLPSDRFLTYRHRYGSRYSRGPAGTAYMSPSLGDRAHHCDHHHSSHLRQTGEGAVTSSSLPISPESVNQQPLHEFRNEEETTCRVLFHLVVILILQVVSSGVFFSGFFLNRTQLTRVSFGSEHPDPVAALFQEFGFPPMPSHSPNSPLSHHSRHAPQEESSSLVHPLGSFNVGAVTNEDNDSKHNNPIPQHTTNCSCLIPQRNAVGENQVKGWLNSPQPFNQTLVMIIDALRFDFAALSHDHPIPPHPANTTRLSSNSSDPPEQSGSLSDRQVEHGTHGAERPAQGLSNEHHGSTTDNSASLEHIPSYINRLPVMHEYTRGDPSSRQAQFFKFVADPPTVTTESIKVMTTGSLRTFMDIKETFSSTQSVIEDNILRQLNLANKHSIAMGDDVWRSLYGADDGVKEIYPFPSFDIKDLHTVDNGVWDLLGPTLKRSDWTLLIAHFLGVDHVGHKAQVDDPAMAAKLSQYDKTIEEVIDLMNADSDRLGNTLFMVLGDHGQTMDGSHGGATPEERESALFVYSLKPLGATPPHRRDGKKHEMVMGVAWDSLLFLLGVNEKKGTDGKMQRGGCENVVSEVSEVKGMNKTKKMKAMDNASGERLGDDGVIDEMGDDDVHFGDMRDAPTLPMMDIVPTISLLMGLPIPFSSLGAVTPHLVPPITSLDPHWTDFALRLAHINPPDTVADPPVTQGAKMPSLGITVPLGDLSEVSLNMVNRLYDTRFIAELHHANHWQLHRFLTAYQEQAGRQLVPFGETFGNEEDRDEAVDVLGKGVDEIITVVGTSYRYLKNVVRRVSRMMNETGVIDDSDLLSRCTLYEVCARPEWCSNKGECHCRDSRDDDGDHDGSTMGHDNASENDGGEHSHHSCSGAAGDTTAATEGGNDWRLPLSPELVRMMNEVGGIQAHLEGVGSGDLGRVASAAWSELMQLEGMLREFYHCFTIPVHATVKARESVKPSREESHPVEQERRNDYSKGTELHEGDVDDKLVFNDDLTHPSVSGVVFPWWVPFSALLTELFEVVVSLDEWATVGDMVPGVRLMWDYINHFPVIFENLSLRKWIWLRGEISEADTQTVNVDSHTRINDVNSTHDVHSHTYSYKEDEVMLLIVNEDRLCHWIKAHQLILDSYIATSRLFLRSSLSTCRAFWTEYDVMLLVCGVVTGLLVAMATSCLLTLTHLEEELVQLSHCDKDNTDSPLLSIRHFVNLLLVTLSGSILLTACITVHYDVMPVSIGKAMCVVHVLMCYVGAIIRVGWKAQLKMRSSRTNSMSSLADNFRQVITQAHPVVMLVEGSLAPSPIPQTGQRKAFNRAQSSSEVIVKREKRSSSKSSEQVGTAVPKSYHTETATRHEAREVNRLFVSIGHPLGVWVSPMNQYMVGPSRLFFRYGIAESVITLFSFISFFSDSYCIYEATIARFLLTSLVLWIAAGSWAIRREVSRGQGEAEVPPLTRPSATPTHSTAVSDNSPHGDVLRQSLLCCRCCRRRRTASLSTSWLNVLQKSIVM